MTSPSTIQEMKDKLAILANEQRLRAELKRDLRDLANNASTLCQFTAAELADNDGRWVKKVEVVGQKRETNYPQLPASSPWHAADPSGLEPPLGISVAEAPIVGEPHEIERSLRSTQRVGGDLAAGDGGDTTARHAEVSPFSSNKSASVVSLASSAGTGTTSGMKTDVVPSPLAKRKL
jgi:hypothetical protein